MSIHERIGLKHLGQFAPANIATEEVASANDLVDVTWDFEYQAEYDQIVLVFNVTPKDGATTQVYSVGAAIYRDNVVYASSLTGLVADIRNASPGTWGGYNWTNHITSEDRGKIVNGLLQGYVLHNGSTQYFSFEKQTFIPRSGE